MATYFIDFDGVFFRYGTMKPAEGAVHFVNKLVEEGHQVYFTTKRTYQNNEPQHLNLTNTKQILKKLGVKYTEIIEGVSTPRIMINDEGAIAINHKRDYPLIDINIDHNSCTGNKDHIVDKVYNALAAIAWTAWEYGWCEDCDDYAQTITVARSLVSCGKFNHKDLVKRYRKRPMYIIKGQTAREGGLPREYKGQIYKLVSSSDPLYLATDGVSDGAAMKVAAIAAFYLDDFNELIKNTDSITRVTHAAAEARLSALLIVLRFRQILLEEDVGNIDNLLKELKRAVEILNLETESHFFLKQVQKAAKITKEEPDPKNLLIKLSEEIGMEWFAWSTPISACFWSYKADNNFNEWFKPQGDKKIKLDDTIIDADTLKKSILEEDKKHLVKIGQYDDFLKAHEHHWRKRIDTDTFFSIAFSLIAAEQGIKPIKKEAEAVIEVFGDALRDISFRLVYNIKESKKTFSIKSCINAITLRFRIIKIDIVYYINIKIQLFGVRFCVYLNQHHPKVFSFFKRSKKLNKYCVKAEKCISSFSREVESFFSQN